MNTFAEVLAALQRQLDAQQMKAVQVLDNAVVSAGAGSGKTTVLSLRFVKLMLDGTDCDRILALTFTRKAALEMRERIGALLVRISHSQDLDEKTREFFDEQYREHFPLATISTLDSFCGSIARSDALAYGLTADFSMDETKLASALRSRARALLWDCARDPGARVLVETYPGDQLIDLLADMARKDYTLTWRYPDHLVEDLIGKLDGTLDQLHAAISSYFQEVLSAVAMSDGEKSVQGVLRTWEQDWRWAESRDGMASVCAASGALQKPKGKGEGETGTVKFLLKTGLDQAREWMERYGYAYALWQKRDRLAPVMDFLKRWLEEAKKIRRQQGILTFGDVQALAVDILTRNVAVRRRYGAQFDYIMIDEFQDNNDVQRVLLFLLAAKDSFTAKAVPEVGDLCPRKLFFVGDEKQSIYRFRGADVTVFKRLATLFPSLDPIDLATNYRTGKKLTSVFQLLFQGVMGQDPAPFAASFSSITGIREGNATCTVLLKPKVKDRPDDVAENAEAEAYAVAAMIERMITGDRYLIDDGKGGTRRPRPSDIAILMRSTGHQTDFERALTARHIPYAISSVSRSLFLEAVAGDLYCLLQLLVYPDDGISYASVLRSPLCHLPDREIGAILAKNLEPFDPAASGNPRYRSFCTFFASLKEKSAVLGLADLLQYAWVASGYRMCYVAHPGFQAFLEHARHLDLLARKMDEEGKSLPEFLAQIRPKIGTSDKLDEDLGDILEEQAEGVRIMTIHKAKGLEFPIVFVVGMASVPKKTQGPKCWRWKEKGVRVLDCCDVSFSEVYAGEGAEQEERQAELKRLLYVAVTRAEQHLVCTGVEDKQFDETMMGMVQAALQIDFARKTSASPLVEVGVIEDVPQDALNGDWRFSPVEPERLRSWYAAPLPPRDLAPLRRGVTSLDDEAGAVLRTLPALPGDEVVARHHLETVWGSWVHAMVQRRLGLLDGEDAEPEAFSVLSRKERDALKEGAERMVEAFLDSACYRTEVEPYLASSGAEVRMFFQGEDGTVLEGSIDLLVRRPDGCTIIDFKTDAVEREGGHHRQLACYRDGIRKLYGLPVRMGVVYLRKVDPVTWWT